MGQGQPQISKYIATNFSPRSLTPPTLIKKKIHLTPFIRNPPLIIQINKNKKNGKWKKITCRYIFNNILSNIRDTSYAGKN